MADADQLPALISLLDDESDKVRNAVLDELASYGTDLEEALRGLDDPPDEGTIATIVHATTTHKEISDRPAPAAAGAEPNFHEGQLVRHRRYGYRGVVVAFDESCRADDDWYRANRTQPDREQPWYHVLVHDSGQVTYAAQTSLLPDDSGDEVRHPFVPLFFSEFENGRYVRNDRDWPPSPD